jgi:hypothetical protein
MVTMPLANWPMAMTPLAGTGTQSIRRGLDGNVQQWQSQNGRLAHLSLAGNGSPQLEQATVHGFGDNLWKLLNLKLIDDFAGQAL